MSRLTKDLINVFVYGTLKKGEPNHYWLTRSDNGRAQFVAKGSMVNKYPLIIGTRYNIPFLLNRPGIGNNVEGEIYEVDTKMFSNLDILEDYPKCYDRELQAIATDKGDTLQCWVYIIRNFPDKLLSQPHLISYGNTEERPYIESYLEASSDDLFANYS